MAEIENILSHHNDFIRFIGMFKDVLFMPRVVVM